MLGIAIINYNQWQKTVDCINSIYKTSKCEYKIYLLDNASQNDSFNELLKRYSNDEKIVLIKSEENLGYAKGNNLCIEYAKADNCDYILISNNDIIYEENAIDILLNRIQSGNYLLVEPFIKNIDGSVQICVKSQKPSFKEYMFFSTYIHNLVSEKSKREYYSKLQPEGFSEVYWASGACFMADMKKFERIGFFDPFTFLYYEEYIISYKAVENNLKIAFEPEAKVIHYHGASTGGNANLFIRLTNFKSEIYFFAKYDKLNKFKLNQIRLIRCLEVLFTFTKEKKIKEAAIFIKKSRKIKKELINEIKNQQKSDL